LSFAEASGRVSTVLGMYIQCSSEKQVQREKHCSIYIYIYICIYIRRRAAAVNSFQITPKVPVPLLNKQNTIQYSEISSIWHPWDQRGGRFSNIYEVYDHQRVPLLTKVLTCNVLLLLLYLGSTTNQISISSGYFLQWLVQKLSPLLSLLIVSRFWEIIKVVYYVLPAAPFLLILISLEAIVAAQWHN
jgi:hypothetical protein